MSLYLADAIRRLRPSAEFSFTDNDYSTIKWDVLVGEAPSESEINAAIEAIKKEEIAAEKEIAAAKAALFVKLGITEEEAKLLLS